MTRIRDAALRLKILADSLCADRRAQELVEYALMAGFVSTTCGALMPGVATQISKIFSSVASVMASAKKTGNRG